GPTTRSLDGGRGTDRQPLDQPGPRPQHRVPPRRGPLGPPRLLSARTAGPLRPDLGRQAALPRSTSPRLLPDGRRVGAPRAGSRHQRPVEFFSRPGMERAARADARTGRSARRPSHQRGGRGLQRAAGVFDRPPVVQPGRRRGGGAGGGVPPDPRLSVEPGRVGRPARAVRGRGGLGRDPARGPAQLGAGARARRGAGARHGDQAESDSGRLGAGRGGSGAGARGDRAAVGGGSAPGPLGDRAADAGGAVAVPAPAGAGLDVALGAGGGGDRLRRVVPLPVDRPDRAHRQPVLVPGRGDGEPGRDLERTRRRIAPRGRRAGRDLARRTPLDRQVVWRPDPGADRGGACPAERGPDPGHAGRDPPGRGGGPARAAQRPGPGRGGPGLPGGDHRRCDAGRLRALPAADLARGGRLRGRLRRPGLGRGEGPRSPVEDAGAAGADDGRGRPYAGDRARAGRRPAV
ncbi:MAG: hypothetical protein AVDCRST_MAG73-4014, partial [uncultured Thermomicrobiales bacterium]